MIINGNGAKGELRSFFKDGDTAGAQTLSQAACFLPLVQCAAPQVLSRGESHHTLLDILVLIYFYPPYRILPSGDTFVTTDVQI